MICRVICRLGCVLASKPMVWFAAGLLLGILLSLPLTNAEARSGEAQQRWELKLQVVYQKGYDAGFRECWLMFTEGHDRFWVYPLPMEDPADLPPL